MIISHADDFGLTESINRAISEGLALGRLDSTSVLVTHCQTPNYLNRFSSDGKLHLHLNITEGRPILPAAAIPHLVTSSRQFLPLPQLLMRINFQPKARQDIAKEFAAQLTRFIQLVGKLPAGLDSHHHSHFHPQVGRIVTDLATSKQLPVRWTKQLLRSGFSPRAWLITGAIALAPKHEPTIYDGLLDPRWFTGHQLTQTISTLAADKQWQILWHPADHSGEAWRDRQLTLLKDDKWWQAVAHHNTGR